MTTIATVREALANAIATIDGLPAFPYESDTIKTPAVYIARGGMTPDLVLGGTKQSYTFAARLYVQRTLERQGQVQLDEFCEMAGASSIRTALENEANYTAGVVHYVEVKAVGPTTEATVGGVVYFSVDFTLEVVW